MTKFKGSRIRGRAAQCKKCEYGSNGQFKVNTRHKKKINIENMLSPGSKGYLDLLKCFSLPQTPIEFSIEKKLELKSFKAHDNDSLSGRFIVVCGYETF